MVRHDRTIAVLFVVFGIMTFGGTMLDPLYVPWIRDVLDEGVEVVAVITMTHSVAGIVGSLVVGTWGSRFSARTLMGWGSVIAGVLLLVKFNVPVLWLTLALSAIGGATAVASSVGVETLAQERTPEHVRGRVFGSLQAFIWLASLLGAVVGGVLGEVTSVLVAINVAAGPWSPWRGRRAARDPPRLENRQHRVGVRPLGVDVDVPRAVGEDDGVPLDLAGTRSIAANRSPSSARSWCSHGIHSTSSAATLSSAHSVVPLNRISRPLGRSRTSITISLTMNGSSKPRSGTRNRSPALGLHGTPPPPSPRARYGRSRG